MSVMNPEQMMQIKKKVNCHLPQHLDSSSLGMSIFLVVTIFEGGDLFVPSSS